jgi:hypothetical protein
MTTPDKDVLRTPMKIETLPYSVEQLWRFGHVGNRGRLVLTWDKVMGVSAVHGWQVGRRAGGAGRAGRKMV